MRVLFFISKYYPPNLFTKPQIAAQHAQVELVALLNSDHNAGDGLNVEKGKIVGIGGGSKGTGEGVAQSTRGIAEMGGREEEAR